MKKFEEELNYLIELSGKVLTGQSEAEDFEKHRVLFIKEQQAKIDELTEKNELYFENLCENIAAMKDVANKMKELSQENESLKAQLEKQRPEIPEVPQFVADFIVGHKFNHYKMVEDFGKMSNDSEIKRWIFDNISTNAHGTDRGLKTLFELINHGYTVAKEKRFYLKNKLTNSYLTFYPVTGYYGHFRGDIEKYLDLQTKFTQSEIDNMETGSYEIIEVEE